MRQTRTGFVGIAATENLATAAVVGIAAGAATVGLAHCAAYTLQAPKSHLPWLILAWMPLFLLVMALVSLLVYSAVTGTSVDDLLNSIDNAAAHSQILTANIGESAAHWNE